MPDYPAPVYELLELSQGRDGCDFAREHLDDAAHYAAAHGLVALTATRTFIEVAGLAALAEWRLRTAADVPTRTGRNEWLARAMLAVKDSPNLTDSEIARRVGKSPGTLSRSTEYQTAAALARRNVDPAKGIILTDPERRRTVDGIA